MLLTCDVGNTNTVLGVWSDDHSVTEPMRTWRLSTVGDRTADELAAVTQQMVGFDQWSEVLGLCVSSVVPRASAAWSEISEHYATSAKTLMVNHGFDRALPLDVDEPHAVGADRIVNCAAAVERYGAPVVVIDFGTATTFDVVSGSGAYVGGLIIPGIEISIDALALRAAALRNVDLISPPSVIGRTTSAQVQSGVFAGQAALVEGVCARIFAEAGSSPVIATGGLAGLVASQTSIISAHDPWLTLYGLRLLHNRFG